MAHSHQLCPDNGVCHHSCSGMCFRVLSCEPLSGVYPNDRWPAKVLANHGIGPTFYPEIDDPLPRKLTQSVVSILGEGMNDEPVEPVKDPRTRYFMGWERTNAEMAKEDEEAMADDVYLIHTLHIWPLMGYRKDDGRWKLGQTEIDLYALCGARLRSYMYDHKGLPIEYGEHWADSTTGPGGMTGYDDENETCTECTVKWASLQPEDSPVKHTSPVIGHGQMYVALHTGPASDTTEVSGGSYARQPITFTPSAERLTFESANEQRFSDMPAVTLTHFTIRNAHGQVMFMGALTTPQEIRKGDTASFAPGNLRISSWPYQP
jgi:hypothetical protein